MIQLLYSKTHVSTSPQMASSYAVIFQLAPKPARTHELDQILGRELTATATSILINLKNVSKQDTCSNEHGLSNASA